METVEPRTHLVRQPLKFRMAEVSKVRHLTPRYVRITLTGPDLTDFQTSSADDHLKVLFPAEGQEKPDLPIQGESGISYADGTVIPERRDFTPRHFDPVTGELVLEFVLHGDGPAASWASSASPGQFVGLAGPRGSHVVLLDFDWYLLIGDETALAFIGRQLEELPVEARAIVLVEVDGPEDEIELASPANVQVQWVHRSGEAPGASSVLLDAVRQTQLLDGEFYTWVSGEAGAVRDIRRHLLNERRIVRDWSRFNGHWKYRVPDWDHHEPIDE